MGDTVITIRAQPAMNDDMNSQSGAKVIPLQPLKAKKASERKWGKAVMDLGFCIIPSLLLRAQARLGLNPTQLAVLMHLSRLLVGRRAQAVPEDEDARRAFEARALARYGVTSPNFEEAGSVTPDRAYPAHRGAPGQD